MAGAAIGAVERAAAAVAKAAHKVAPLPEPAGSHSRTDADAGDGGGSKPPKPARLSSRHRRICDWLLAMTVIGGSLAAASVLIDPVRL